jgi:hypothetical protein
MASKLRVGVKASWRILLGLHRALHILPGHAVPCRESGPGTTLRVGPCQPGPVNHRAGSCSGRAKKNVLQAMPSGCGLHGHLSTVRRRRHHTPRVGFCRSMHSKSCFWECRHRNSVRKDPRRHRHGPKPNSCVACNDILHSSLYICRR